MPADFSVNDDEWMALAIDQARAAEQTGEVPVGAVVVHQDVVIGRGGNRTIRDADPTAHAEIVAIRDAGRHLGDWRLEGTSLLVTLEPCPMCMGAIIQARIPRLIYAARDPRYGACGSSVDLATPLLAPHLLQVDAGLRGEECSEMLRSFFGRLREHAPS